MNSLIGMVSVEIPPGTIASRQHLRMSVDSVNGKAKCKSVLAFPTWPVQADTAGTDLVSLDPDTNTDLANPQEKGRTPKP